MGKIRISYECTELIEELKEDIREFGGDLLIEAVERDYSGVPVYVDYFIDGSKEIDLLLNERTVRMTATALLTILEEQNQVL